MICIYSVQSILVFLRTMLRTAHIADGRTTSVHPLC